jgi:hypothetical protein
LNKREAADESSTDAGAHDIPQALPGSKMSKHQ